MDCHHVLMLLTKFDEQTKKEITENKLKDILDTIYSSIPENLLDLIVQDRILVNDSNDISWHYLYLVLHTIQSLCNNELSAENPLFTVEQFRVMKMAVEVTMCTGIIPFLLPQIKTHTAAMRSIKFNVNNCDENILEKYKRLTYTINILLKCYENPILRPALISQLDCLLAALLQLSHAPLIKPTVLSNANTTSSSEFQMTPELYTQFKKEQEEFCKKLNELIDNSPQSTVIKELMVILGIKNNPKWLQINIKRYVTERIMQPNGIIAITEAICDEVSDLGKCWDKLDVATRLIVRSHELDTEKYYNSICSQILKMLSSKNNKQVVAVANCCIKALYDYKLDICTEKIIHAIMKPFLIKYSSSKLEKSQAVAVISENEVSTSIENLCTLFITVDAEFKCLPTTHLTVIALPLFYLYTKSYKSVYIHRSQVKQLLLQMLKNESIRDTIFAIFLNHSVNTNCEFGERLNFCFGDNGGLQVMSNPCSIENIELSDSLFCLVEEDSKLAFSLFTYLLKSLPDLYKVAEKTEQEKLLETSIDAMERIEKEIGAVKLLTLLSGSTVVQQEQIKNPEPLLDFVKFFYTRTVTSYETHDKLTYEQDVCILYTSLMLVKLIVTSGYTIQSWNTFQNFIDYMKQQFAFEKIPKHIATIIEDIESAVKRKGKSYSKNYYDLSADNKQQSEFDKAVADLSDPLLPVRAHGIIALTKLIESRHPDTIVKKDILLCLFQENLDHEDSFIYLAAINGISAMSSMFPEKVIEILVQEFIGMTQRSNNRDIPPETRAKLGEILVKTTRSLGEMTPKYKTLLINGFLCGTKDSDSIVRASSLSCLGEFCKIMGFRLGNLIIEILYCVGCIIKTDKDDSCRRAGVLVATLLLRGLGKDALTELGENLVTLYRSLKYLRDNDKDPVLQLHAQLALEEFDDIVQKFLFAQPKLEKSIFLLSN